MFLKMWKANQAKPWTSLKFKKLKRFTNREIVVAKLIKNTFFRSMLEINSDIETVVNSSLESI